MTLHDAVAEELAQLIIPLNDLDRTWRQRLWERAVGDGGNAAAPASH